MNDVGITVFERLGFAITVLTLEGTQTFKICYVAFQIWDYSYHFGGCWIDRTAFYAPKATNCILTSSEHRKQ
jgi:hypothetical protein